MPILLRDIRIAFQQHLNTQVTTTLTFRAASGTTINVGESFLVDFRAMNSVAVDSVQLKNVVYHLRVMNPAIAKFTKPSAAQGIGRVGSSPTAATITDAAFAAGVAEYFLHPPAGSDPKTLAPGETDTIVGLPAKALAVGSASVQANVYGDPDLAWLLPAMEDSPIASKTLTVLE